MRNVMRTEELQLHPANITEHSTHRLTCPFSFQAHVLSGYRTRKKYYSVAQIF